MEDADLERDARIPEPPRPSELSASHDSLTHYSGSSESSELVGEGVSLLGKDSKQVVTYGATESVGGEQDVVAEVDEVDAQRTPRAIAAVISVLLVGKNPRAEISHAICFNKFGHRCFYLERRWKSCAGHIWNDIL
jgi:hypothetical protein